MMKQIRGGTGRRLTGRPAGRAGTGQVYDRPIDRPVNFTLNLYQKVNLSLKLELVSSELQKQK